MNNLELNKIEKLKAIHEKAKLKKDYSLGDCLLIGQIEKTLINNFGYTKEKIQELCK